MSVPIDLLKVLEPLLVELDELRENLTKNEFIGSVLTLYRELTVTERNIIRDFGRDKSPVVEKLSFTPKISKKSKNLASSRSMGNILERFDVLNKVSKLNKERVASNITEKILKECTFKPDVKKIAFSKKVMPAATLGKAKKAKVVTRHVKSAKSVNEDK